MKRGDRKTRIELTANQADKLVDDSAAAAWYRLREELRAMADPEAKSPRFNALLRAIWAAATNEQS